MEAGAPAWQGKMPGMEGACRAARQTEGDHPTHLRQGVEGLDQGRGAQATDGARGPNLRDHGIETGAQALHQARGHRW